MWLLGLDAGTWLVVAMVTLLLWLTLRRPRGLPPGPAFILPLVGHLPLMRGDPRDVFKAMRQRYGDVFHLYFGSRLVVVLNGYSTIKEAFVKYGDVFSHRPDTLVSYEVSQFLGLAGASGEHWQEQRKFVVGTLREFGFGKNVLQDKILEEVSIFVDAIKQEQGEGFDIEFLLHTAVSNIICNIVFGKRFDYDDPKFHTYLHKTKELLSLVGGTAVVNFFPWLRFLPGDPFKFHRIKGNVRFLEDNFTKVAVREHMANYNPSNQSLDFIDAYIKEIKRMEAEGKKTTINVENLVKVIADLFIAGTDTTATTIRWALLIFLNYPDVQEEFYAVVHNKLGAGRLPRLEDRRDMPYVEAFIMEVLRFANIAILGVPHASSTDVWFRGHFIPKGADLFFNTDSVQNDPDIWDKPEEFNPGRFLENGQVLKKEEFIPFSIGRRTCPGEALARMELFLFLVTMVQRFRFVSPENSPVPKIVGLMGLVHAPLPFRLRAVPRCEA